MIALNDTLRTGQAVAVYFRLSAFHLPLVLSIEEQERQAVDELRNAGIQGDKITFDADGETIRVDLTVTQEQAGMSFGRFQQAVMNRLSQVLNTPVELVNALETKAGQVGSAVTGTLSDLKGGLGEITGTLSSIGKSIPWLVALAVVGIVIIFRKGGSAGITGVKAK